MTALNPHTEQFLTMVKETTIAQLVEADKDGWFEKKDYLLTAKEIQAAFMEGTLTRKVEKDGSATSSATYISKETAEVIISDIAAEYPHTVTKEGGINFRVLKAELDPAYKKAACLDMKNTPTFDEMMSTMPTLIEAANKAESSLGVRK